jgi:hypothetical protein
MSRLQEDQTMADRPQTETRVKLQLRLVLPAGAVVPLTELLQCLSNVTVEGTQITPYVPLTLTEAREYDRVSDRQRDDNGVAPAHPPD